MMSSVEPELVSALPICDKMIGSPSRTRAWPRPRSRGSFQVMVPNLHMPARASAHAFPSLATAWVTGTDQFSCVERTAEACCPSPLPPPSL